VKAQIKTEFGKYLNPKIIALLIFSNSSLLTLDLLERCSVFMIVVDINKIIKTCDLHPFEMEVI
jgi:hypothetical protein